MLKSLSRNGGTLKILVTYPSGEQKVLLDDGQTVILSTPYSDGRRKIFSEGGAEIGWLSREYSYNYQTATLKDGTEYNLAQKSIIPGVNEVCWEKTKSPHTDNTPSSTQSDDTNNLSPSSLSQEDVVISKSNTDNKSHGSELTKEDRVRLWDLEYRSLSLEIGPTDTKDMIDLKNEINQITRFIMSKRRDVSDLRESSRKNKMSHNNAQYYIGEKEKEKEACEKELAEKTIQLNRLVDEQNKQKRRRDFLTNSLINSLESYYKRPSIFDESRFLDVGIKPLKKIDGQKAYADGKIILDTLLLFFNMEEGFPKGWKYAEYLLRKMGIKTKELIDVRRDIYY